MCVCMYVCIYMKLQFKNKKGAQIWYPCIIYKYVNMHVCMYPYEASIRKIKKGAQIWYPCMSISM